MKQARSRFSFLVMCALMAVIVVACGRASEEDINNALNITATATLSEQDIAMQTAAAVSELETRTAAQSAIGSPGSGEADLASAGNPVMGRTNFAQRCMGCHRAGGTGPLLSGPDNPAVALGDQAIFDLVRTGDGHAAPPGPLTETDITNDQLINIIAFIRDQSE